MVKNFRFLLIIFILVSILCYPQDLNLKLKPVFSNVSLKKFDDHIEVYIELDIAPEIHIYASKNRFFEIKETKVKGLQKNSQIIYPKSHIYDDEYDGKLKVYTGKVTFIIKKRFQGKKGENWEIEGYLQYQACSERVCYPPEKVFFSFKGKIPRNFIFNNKTLLKNKRNNNSNKVELNNNYLVNLNNILKKFKEVKRTSGYLEKDKFLKFLESKNNSKDIFEGKSIWLVIVIILVGGVLLNLTPCVLPIIPINLAIIGANVSQTSKGKGFLLGGIYGLGIALSYGILGILVIFTGSTFGSLNSSPWFNLGISILFIILSLALFDIIIIDFSKYRKGGVKESQKGKIITAFIMGGVSALLASACVAPVVISVLIYSNTLYAKGYYLAIFLPLLLGIGMGLPWPFAGAGLSILPKPGKWMVKVKYGFGIFILLLGLYYGYLSIELFKYRYQNNNREVSTSSIKNKNINMNKILISKLQKAYKENKLVFIDFWATWCKSCMLMEKTTFKNKEVKKVLDKYIVIKYQAETPQKKEIKEVLKSFNVIGLPTYIILKPVKKR